MVKNPDNNELVVNIELIIPTDAIIKGVEPDKVLKTTTLPPQIKVIQAPVN